jgi:hypothetical protein
MVGLGGFYEQFMHKWSGQALQPRTAPCLPKPGRAQANSKDDAMDKRGWDDTEGGGMQVWAE